MTIKQSFSAFIETALPVLMLRNLYRLRWILLLGLVVWINAVAVAYFTHQNRVHTALLEQLKYEQYQLEMEWEALRLEQGTLAEHNRIESIAREKLSMKNVAATDEVLVKNKH